MVRSSVYKESFTLIGIQLPENTRQRGLRSKPRCSPCIFQVVVSLSIRDFLIITTTYTDKDRLGLQRQ